MSGIMKMHVKKKSFQLIGLSMLMLAFLPSFVTRALSIPFWSAFCYSLILICDIFFLQRMKRTAKPVIWTSIFYGYLLLVTVFFNTDQFLNCLVRTFLAISMSLYIEYMFRCRTPKDAIHILMLAMELFNYINLASMIIYPSGMYRVISNGLFEELVKVEPGSTRTSARVLWLAGHQTMMIRFTLPAIIIAVLYGVDDGRFKPNLRSVSLIVVCLAETIIANSAGNYLFLALVITVFLVFYLHGRINMWIIVPLIVAVYVFLITSTEDLSIFNWLSGKLQRAVRISTRVPIWRNALSAWLERPIFGFGFIEDGSLSIREILGLGNPHSSYLWTLYEGGIVGGVLLVAYIVFWARRKGRYWERLESQLIYAGMIGLLACMIDDDHMYRSVFFLILFELTYHIPEIIESKKWA